jgi:hypothetical protein
MNAKELVNLILSGDNSINAGEHRQYTLADVQTFIDNSPSTTHMRAPFNAYLEGRFHDVLRLLSKHTDLHASILKELSILQLVQSNGIDIEAPGTKALVERTLIQAKATMNLDITGNLAGQLDEVAALFNL